MKIGMPKLTSNTVVFLLIVLIYLCSLYNPGTPLSKYCLETIEGPVYETALTDSLPHYLYRRIEDSIQQATQKEIYVNLPETKNKFLSIGISTDKDQNKCFLIEGYQLNPNASIHYKKGKTFISYPVWDKEFKEGGCWSRSGYLVEKETRIKFYEEKDTSENAVAIPVSIISGKILEVIFIILKVTLAIAAFYCLLFIPYKVLLLISKGKSFSDETTGGLYIISWFLIGMSLTGSLLKIALHLVFKYKIPPQIEFSYYNAVMHNWQILITGLIILLFARAFKKGTQLQEEQALTV